MLFLLPSFHYLIALFSYTIDWWYLYWRSSDCCKRLIYNVHNYINIYYSFITHDFALYLFPRIRHGGSIYCYGCSHLKFQTRVSRRQNNAGKQSAYNIETQRSTVEDNCNRLMCNISHISKVCLVWATYTK